MRPAWRLLGLVSAMAVVAGGACNDDADPGDGSGGDAGAGGERPVGGSSSGGAAASAAESSGGVLDIGAGGQPICVADFPCFEREAECVGDNRIQRLRDVSCREVCPPGPCSGGSCLPTGEAEECPPGTRCRDCRVSVSGYTAICDDGEGGSGGNQDFDPCGNGTVDSGESCDDANREPEDGCSPNCRIEPDWVCAANEPCRSTLRDGPCTDACWDRDACIERDSGVTCECPEPGPDDCGDVRFRNLVFIEGWRCSAAVGVSGDALTAIGSCSRKNPDNEALESALVVWRLGSGVQELELDEPTGARLTGVNGDGSVIIGSDGLGRAFRWTETETDIIADGAYPWATSADGTVVVGQSGEQAFAWRAETGFAILTGPDEEPEGYALGVSADGAVTVGSIRISGRARAVRWNSSGEAELLPVPDDTTDSEASACSEDCSVIVGSLWFGMETRAVRWTSDGIEELAGPTPSGAFAISPDGSRIVGNAGTDSWLWSDAGGEGSSFREILAQAGVNVDNWFFGGMSGISADGRVAVGGAQYVGDDQLNHDVRAVVAFLP